MTPLEKALQEQGKINYCDECESFQIVGNAAYCKVDGKLIHPIMLIRGQGTGPAYNCKKRGKPITNADRIRSMSGEELAEFINVHVHLTHAPWCDVDPESWCEADSCVPCVLDWLKQEIK